MTPEGYEGIPPLHHACAVLDCLYRAVNGLSRLEGWAAGDIRKQLDYLRQRVAVEVMPDLLKAEIEEARREAAK
jgi:hypothetical protein